MKILSFIFCFILLFSFVGCSRRDKLDFENSLFIDMESILDAQTAITSETDSESETVDETETSAITDTLKDAEVTRVVSFTSSVKAGENVRLEICGFSSVRYDIYVYYSENKPASVEELAPVYSDGDGRVMWEWKVPSGTKSGRKKIIVTGGGEKLTLYLDIE